MLSLDLASVVVRTVHLALSYGACGVVYGNGSVISLHA